MQRDVLLLTEMTDAGWSSGSLKARASIAKPIDGGTIPTV